VPGTRAAPRGLRGRQAFTIGVRTIDGFYRERRFVTSILGIPDEFLPDHREAWLGGPPPLGRKPAVPESVADMSSGR
jgi:hypothetical protein